MFCICLICVNTEPDPVHKQQDRWGSRWISLDLTLPTVFHPLGPPLPICMSLQRKKSRMQAFMCGLGEGSYTYCYKYQAENSRRLWARQVYAAIYNRPFMFTLDCSNTCLLRVSLSCKAKWHYPGNKYPHGAYRHLTIKPCWIFSLSGLSKPLSQSCYVVTQSWLSTQNYSEKIRNGWIHSWDLSTGIVV